MVTQQETKGIPRYKLLAMARQASHKTRVIFDDLIDDLDKGCCLWCNGDGQLVKLGASTWYCLTCDTVYYNGNRDNGHDDIAELDYEATI